MKAITKKFIINIYYGDKRSEYIGGCVVVNKWLTKGHPLFINKAANIAHIVIITTYDILQAWYGPGSQAFMARVLKIP